MAKKEITVICNYPTEENMEEFNNRFHNAVAIALIESNTPEFIKAYMYELERQIEEESLN